MLDANTPLINFLADPTNHDMLVIDLYTFGLVDGTFLRYSGTNTALTIPSGAFPADCLLNTGANRTFALGPGFSRSKVSRAVGVQPTDLKIEAYPKSTDLVEGFTFLDAVELRLFDGATVELDRFFAPRPATGAAAPIDTSLGCICWFYGRVADVVVGRSKASLTIKSMLNLLQVNQSPPRLFEAACGFSFGGARCGYDRVNGRNALGTSTGIGQITVTVANSPASTRTVVELTATLPLDYRDGTLTGATGANAGYVRTIYDNGSGTEAVLARELPQVPASGDTFTVLPGCDHTLGGAQGCTGRQNTLRYGGMPYVPPPELAV